MICDDCDIETGTDSNHATDADCMNALLVLVASLKQQLADRYCPGMNSRQLAEMIWKETVSPCYEGMGMDDNDPEPEDREFAIQGIEVLLERHTPLLPDPELKKMREENEQ